MSLAQQFFDVKENTYDDNRELFVRHMNMLRDMKNEEHVLYKKWKEVQEFKRFLEKSSICKVNIWTPTNILDKDHTLEELQNIYPNIEFVRPDDKKAMEEWLIYRTFIHTMEFEQNPGRFLRFTIRDLNTGKILGVSSIGSDIINVSCRDKYIRWDEETKIRKGRIRHSAIATTIVPTQPLGYNFLGGKLIASMMCMPPVQEAWKEIYGDTLVGLTTTSLYGKHSMYQRIPFWKELGETTGKIMLKPDDEVYEVWHHWLQEHEPEKYKKQTEGKGVGPATGVKQKILVMIMQELGLKQSQYMHGFQRGVYYAPFYENTLEFLRGEIGEDKLVPSQKLRGGVENVLKWWVPKATNRYDNLFDQNRLNDEILYYNTMIGMSWEEAKKTYLQEVGR